MTDPAALRKNAERAAKLMKALSNPHRLMVLCHLAERERSVGELGTLVGLGQSALSQHLARLRADGLVKTRRDRQTIHYSLDGEASLRVMKTLYEIYCRDG
jgi:DNA-binding transcriptional ArsR family regulator